MKLTTLGIRHHGVGSAKNCLARLEEIQPDHIIIEGPMEMMDSIKDVDLNRITPPVAILLYNPNNLSESSFYPFAEYSPEWQTMKFAQRNEISFETADLPKKISFGLAKKAREVAEKELEVENNDENENEAPIDDEKVLKPEGFELHNQPIQVIANLAGYENVDLWWERHFEQKFVTSPKDHFEAVLELMSALRETYVNQDFERNELREAFMREAVRKAEKAGKENIVFICGAWHAPAVMEYKSKGKSDRKIMKKLPKGKVETTWIPWLNTRLSWQSGYGAGIEAPGWYEHLWKYPEDTGERWLIHVAQVFRKKEIDVSTAHIIEALRLSTTLAAMRDLSRPGLPEMDQAVISTICMGDDVLMKYIKEELTVGKKIGKIPDDLPKLPLQKDFEKKIKTYRLQIREDAKNYQLDLRKPIGLEKSTFLHRLQLLNIKWGQIVQVRSTGSFKEVWMLEWQPEIMLDIIDKGIWGNTVLLAAQNYVNHIANISKDVVEITDLIKSSIVAQLFDSVDFLIKRIQDLASLTSDVVALISAVIPLIEISRYSDIRQTDVDVLTNLIEGLLVKIFISIEVACYGINYELAETLFKLITGLNDKLGLLENEDLQNDWIECLCKMADQDNVSPLIKGAVYRIMLDNKRFDQEKVRIGFGRALSQGAKPMDSAYWIEGFLKGSAMILILDNTIWNILYIWLQDLDSENFDDLLPILRRTFSNYSTNERFQLGQKAKKGLGTDGDIEIMNDFGDFFNTERAEKGLMATAKILF